MPLATQNERTAVLHWGDGSLPVANGTLDSGDREQLLGVPRFSDLSGGGVDVLPGVGQLTLTGFAPIVSTSVDVLPGVGQLAITGHAPTIEVPVTVTPGVGALTLTGLAPTISTLLDVLPGVGVLALTGYAPSVTTTPGVVKPAQSPTVIIFVDANGNQLVGNLLVVKTGETGTRWLKLAGNDGNPEDLTGATGLTVTIAKWNGVPLVNGRQLTVVDLTNGIVSFQQQLGDFPAAGTFNLEAKIVRADGSIGEFPENGYATVMVVKSLTQ